MLITIVAFLAVLIVLVLAHECGHFFTARATGVKVEEFGIGFPAAAVFHKAGGDALFDKCTAPGWFC